MAKSETVPSIVVHSGTGNNSGGSNGEMEQRQTNRLSRLAKQEEFDLEENYSPSPVTIHIEDGGSGTDENSEAHCTWVLGDDRLDVEDSDSELSTTVQTCENGTEYLSDGNCNGRKSDTSSRSHTQSKSSNKHQQLGKQGSSQGSVDDSSPTLSRDSSTETYTDSTGIDLQQFIIETLHKSQKDRIMLLKIEQELVTLVKDNKCQTYKFPNMSSYNRMLVHRIAAFFGLDHNVDKNGTSVIVNKTKTTRLPEIRFKEQIRDELAPDEPKKLILKRGSSSFEDGKESPERQSSTDSRRSKSFEEREEEYEKARRRIFNKDEGYVESPFSRSQEGTSSRRSSQEDLRWAGEPRPWSSTDSDSSGWKAGGSFESEGATQNGGKTFSVLSKSDLDAKDMLLPSSGAKPAVTKASSFGGISVLSRENGKPSNRLTKAESFNATPTCSSSTAKEEIVATEPKVDTTSSPVEANDHCVSVASPKELPSSIYPSLPSSSEQFLEQPLSVQSPAQQVSSQQTSWEASGKEASKNSSNGKSPPVWQVPVVESLPPGSVIINSSSVAPYFTQEGVMYRNKNVVTTPPQAFVVTPLQSFIPSPQLSVPLESPISSGSNASPPLAQQHSPVSATYHAAPAVVYIPCLASQQVPAILTPQTQVQALPLQQQQSSHQQLPQCTLEHRQVNQNVNAVSDLSAQLSNLNFLSQSIGVNPSIQQTMPSPHSVDLGKTATSQAYAFSAVKVPNYFNQASVIPPHPQQQAPVYYVQQVPPGHQNMRYVCPSGPVMSSSPAVTTNPAIDLNLKKQEIIAEQRGLPVAQQVGSHISGQQLLPPGYSLVTFAQNMDNLNVSAMPYFSYAVPSHPGSSSTTLANSYSSHHGTNNILLPGVSANSSAPLLTQQPLASSHPPNYIGQQHQSPAVQQTAYPTFRPHTPPTSGCNPHGAPTPLLSYAFYTLPQMNAGSGGQQQPSAVGGTPPQFTPSFVTGGFQVVRPNIPAAMCTVKNTTPPPPSPGVIPTQFTTTPNPSHLGKGQIVLQLGKDSDQSIMDCQNIGAGACSNNHDQQCPRIPSIHLGPQSVRVPMALPMYRHGLSIVQDMRLLGQPLHHQLSPLFLPQQRPLCRYPHPSALAHVGLSQPQQQQQQRGAKLRRQRSKGSASGGGGTNKNANSGNHILEVEGLPEGMKRSEIERYLEPVTHHGAKIQFFGIDGSILAQGQPTADFVVNSCRCRVVAAFETDTAAQSALLNIKTTKFQLRSTAHRGGAGVFTKSIS